MNPYFLAPAVCPLCAASKEFLFLENFKNDREWSLYECLSCRVQFWLPLTVPNAPEQYEIEVGYEGKSHVLYKENAKAIAEGYWNIAQFFKEFGATELKGKKLLDIGCGTGEVIFVAEQLGASVEGIDFNKTAVDLGRERFSLQNMSTADAYIFLKDKKNTYDVITAFEVIEHIADPGGFLKLIHASLKEGGLLVISTPNRNRYWKRIDPKADNWDFPYQHLLRWDAYSLKTTAERYGFRKEILKTEPPTDWFVGKLRYLVTTVVKQKTAQEQSASEKVREKMGFGRYMLVKKMVVGICSIPAFFMANVFGFEGAHLFGVFQKRGS